MTIAFTPPVDPSPGSVSGRDYPLYVSESASYRQVAPRGTNIAPRRQELVWEALSPADADAILAQLDQAGGWEVLVYALPWEATASNWRIDGAPVQRLSAQMTRSISVSLIEATDPVSP